jgi:hypothetical protein
MVMTALAPTRNGYRDTAGRFLKGNPGGPGNPYAKQVAALKAALFEALTREDIQAVVRRMIGEALAGNVAAARLLLEYAVGKPLPGSAANALDAELAVDLSEERLAQRLTVDELKTWLALMQKLGMPHEPGNDHDAEPYAMVRRCER